MLPSSGTIRRPLVVNLVAHPKGRGSKLHLPPNGRIRGDQNRKCVHEGRALHLSVESKKELG
jgi:hypothetical protein